MKIDLSTRLKGVNLVANSEKLYELISNTYNNIQSALKMPAFQSHPQRHRLCEISIDLTVMMLDADEAANEGAFFGLCPIPHEKYFETSCRILQKVSDEYINLAKEMEVIVKSVLGAYDAL